ncbi:MAG TPA: hypothetical protein VFM10_12090 [Terriglobales bacterium]|jgi:hypothetical protein|nr:hypothetical protein [Terriglobales bacterium]
MTCKLAIRTGIEPSMDASRSRASLFSCASLIFIFAVIVLSCGGGSGNSETPCGCTPSEDSSKDYRHEAKHIPLPSTTPQEIDVATILSWAQPSPPPFNAPRSGRELQLFHIARAYLQSADRVRADCDLHFEISQTASKTAPRIIVETPIDSEYCPVRENIESLLTPHGIKFPDGGELNPAVPVSVVGLAFLDFEHNRGSTFVATTWELHPAIVSVIP